MHLELAENDNMYLQQQGAPIEGEETISPYIFVPGQFEGQGVYVREDYFDNLNEDDWERTMMFLEANQPGLSLFGLGKKGRERRAERRERRAERKLLKIETRAAGRAGVAKAGGGMAGFGQALSGTLGSIFGGGTPEQQAQLQAQAGARKPMPWLGIGLGVVIIGGVIYFATRKRKR